MSAVGWFITIWYSLVAIVGVLFLLDKAGMKLPVSGAKYSRLLSAYDSLSLSYHSLLQKHEAAIRHMRTGKSESMFSDDEIKKLVFLCHPDKHNNSPTSQELTKKLLELRKK